MHPLLTRAARLVTPLALFAALAAPAAPAYAGSPHFVSLSTTQDGAALTVSGKEAGLGNETQVHIMVTADAQCVNHGGNDPHAGNKQSFSAEGDFPVQNGKAEFALMLLAAFQPDCSPPMSVVWSNVVVSDAAHGLSESL